MSRWKSLCCYGESCRKSFFHGLFYRSLPAVEPRHIEHPGFAFRIERRTLQSEPPVGVNRANPTDSVRSVESKAENPFEEGEVNSSSWLKGESCGPFCRFWLPYPIQDYLGHRDPKHTVHYTRVAAVRFEGLWKS